MDQKNVKQRDVLPFTEFVKARDTAMKVVQTKKGENPNPAAHDIKGEDLYVKHDANIYKASGIPHNEKIADTNNLANANQVDVQGKEHDGQDTTGKKANEKQEPSKADKKAAEESAALVGNAHAINVIDESKVNEGKQDVIKKVEELLKKAGFTNTDYVVSLQGPTLILAKGGEEKMNDKLRGELEATGIEFL